MPLSFPQCSGTPWWRGLKFESWDHHKEIFVDPLEEKRKRKPFLKFRKGLLVITTPKGRT